MHNILTIHVLPGALSSLGTSPTENCVFGIPLHRVLEIDHANVRRKNEDHDSIQYLSQAVSTNSLDDASDHHSGSDVEYIEDVSTVGVSLGDERLGLWFVSRYLLLQSTRTVFQVYMFRPICQSHIGQPTCKWDDQSENIFEVSVSKFSRHTLISHTLLLFELIVSTEVSRIEC